MSALSAMLSNFEEVSSAGCMGQLIPTVKMVKMEHRNHVESYFGIEFLAICNHSRVMAA